MQFMADSKPLRGVVLCCSSITPDERNRLAEIATQLGADHTFDLTSSVTHLLIGSLDTPKTRFVAKERPDIKVLRPEWLDAVNTEWMTGGEIDVAAFEREYTAPAFFGLKICLTGFDDLQQRSTISDLSKQYGAEYSGDLTRDITHLIAAVPQGKKYEYAKEWQIKIVGIEWLYQSIERGLALDEAYFALSIKSEERGKNAWRREPAQQVIGKRQREAGSEQAAQDAPRRKLRRAASEKFGSQSGAIWADITSGKPAQDKNDDWNNHPEREDPVQPPKDNSAENAQAPGQGPKDEHHGTTKARTRSNLGIFAGTLVYVHGFDKQKTKVLHQHLFSNGARTPFNPDDLMTYSEDDQIDGFLLTPHDVSDDRLPPLPDVQMQRVTEWWVEVCLHAKSLTDPSSALFCTPMSLTHIDGFQDVVVCSTSFQPVDLLHLSKVVKLIGARYDEFLKPATSVLLVANEHPKVEKLNFAIEHRIPVVKTSWLQACIQSQTLEPLDDHLLPAYASKLTSRKEAIQIKLFSEGSSPAKDHAVRPPQSAKMKIAKAQHALKPVEFRRPRALNEASESPEHHSAANPGEHTRPLPTPLQELPPGSNAHNQLSPSTRPSQSKSASHSPTKENDVPALDGTTSQDAFSVADHAPMPSKAQVDNSSEHLHNAITALLAQKQASRPSSAHEATTSAVNFGEPRRRRRGILGRASSATSNPPGSALSNLSRASSVSGLSQLPGKANDPGPATQALQQQQHSLAPSQALVYEDLEVQREREEMIRRLGGEVPHSLVRDGAAAGATAAVGVIRDIGAAKGGVAGRLRRRARESRGATADDGW